LAGKNASDKDRDSKANTFEFYSECANASIYDIPPEQQNRKCDTQDALKVSSPYRKAMLGAVFLLTISQHQRSLNLPQYADVSLERAGTYSEQFREVTDNIHSSGIYVGDFFVFTNKLSELFNKTN
jgi:hypothetical protein